MVLFFGNEPMGLLFSMIAALLLGGYYGRQIVQIGWARSIIYSSAYSLAFLGLTLGGYIFLRSNIESFNTMHQSFTSRGSISWSKWKNALRTWGGAITQLDLQSSHYVETSILATLPVTDPSLPVLYQTMQIRQSVPQNSIVRFRGQVEMISGRKKNADEFNTYLVNAHYLYDVVNQSNAAVETEFLFPLASSEIYFEDIRVQMDGRDIDGLQANGIGLQWMMHMEPNQLVTVSVSYSARGMDTYQFVVPQAREIKDFNLSISSDDADMFVLVNPGGESIRQSTKTLPDGTLVLEVSIDHTVVAPVVGMSYIQRTEPYAPLDLFLKMLRFVPRSILFLMAVIILMLIISKISFGLHDIALIQAIFWLHALVLMMLGPYFENSKALMLAASVFTAIIVYIATRRLQVGRFLTISILCWIVVLLGIYPLTGEFVNAFPFNQYDNLVLVAILLFMFSSLVWARVGLQNESK